MGSIKVQHSRTMVAFMNHCSRQENCDHALPTNTPSTVTATADQLMTWSILAREPDGRFGIAIASRFFSVGSLCIHSRAGVGAIATQALMNPLYGPQGMAPLRLGTGALAQASAEPVTA